ncbi:MAG: hypothetical protein ACRD1X_19630, partial [Vicinamibacteria bacterium]
MPRKRTPPPLVEGPQRVDAASKTPVIRSAVLAPARGPKALRGSPARTPLFLETAKGVLTERTTFLNLDHVIQIR